MSEYTKGSFLISIINGIKIIKFNRPKKRNSFSDKEYKLLTKILNEDSHKDEIIMTILTGSEEYFSSGTDLTIEEFNGNAAEMFKEICSYFRDFVSALINYPKLLVAVVNGPAIGLGVTLLLHCDVVYASDKATFQTPFLNLGLCPEACSSYLFPLMLGNSKANEMLLLGHKMNAEEAHNFGLVSKVIPNQYLDEFIKRLCEKKHFSVNALKHTKALIKRNVINTLHNVNDNEVNYLAKCLQSEELFEMLMKFNSRQKSKL